MHISEVEKNYPGIAMLTHAIVDISPLQKKHLNSYLPKQDALFYETTEAFIERITRYGKAIGFDVYDLAESYVQICSDFVAEQIKFSRTGMYTLNSADEANDLVYSDRDVMFHYMLGLAVTQFLWENHYKIQQFFKAALSRTPKGGRYLEVGPGHGLGLVDALQLGRFHSLTALDISPTSIELSRTMLQCFCDEFDKVEFVLADLLRWDSPESFDFLVAGEILEHVESPDILLHAMFNLLKPEGEAFVTTCANCPAIDHLFRFTTADEIRKMIQSAGFRIKDELVLEKETGVLVKGQGVMPTINYAALLEVLK